MTDKESVTRLKVENKALKRRVANLRAALADLLAVAWPSDDKRSRTSRAIRKAEKALRSTR
jgi:hypothetical protein